MMRKLFEKMPVLFTRHFPGLPASRTILQ